MRPPPLPHQLEILHRVLAGIARHRDSEDLRNPVVVFDLDATLFDNRPRTYQILMEYREEIAAEDPEVAEALGQLSVETIKYLLSETLRSCGITHAEVVRDVSLYWRDRFFADAYISFDEPVEGALSFVRACHEAGATIVYLTGRDIPSMLLGTMAQLRDDGFPVAVPGVEVVLKPDMIMQDEAFKRAALPKVAMVGEVIAFFDNEPGNCNLALKHFPDAIVAWMDTQKIPGAPEPDEGVEPISDFRLE